MSGLSVDAEDELLAWIEAAQLVSRLCEVSLAAQRGDGAGPQRAGTSAGAAAGAVSRPSQLTYGELPLRQLKAALAKVRDHGGLVGAEAGGCGCRFFDLGCGGGKLVLAAAIMLEPLTSDLEVVGIELLEPLVAEAEALRGECVAKLAADGEPAAAAAVAAARFVCGDVLDGEVSVAAGADWAEDYTTARSAPGCTVVVVNGLCFPTKVKAAICDRLLRDQDVGKIAANGSVGLAGSFVLSTSPLPWLSHRSQTAADSGQDGGAGALGVGYELVYTNEDDDEMDFIAMALGDDTALLAEGGKKDEQRQVPGDSPTGARDSNGNGGDQAGSKFWDDFCLYLYRRK
jgi:SAM-dependent methyltransferase